MAGETFIPFGLDRSVQLFRVTIGTGGSAYEVFMPIDAAASSGGRVAGYSTLDQPLRNDDDIEFRSVITQQSLNASDSRSGSLPSAGLQVAATQYNVDPQQSNNFLRNTAGDVYGQGNGADSTLTNRQGIDVRAFLYGFNVTGGDAKPVEVNDDGEVVVTTAAAVPGTITTAADQATATGSNTSIAAANSSRKQIIIQNVDATDAVRVGDTNITATRGIRLAAGESVTLEVTAQIFARAEAGTPSVAVTQIQ